MIFTILGKPVPKQRPRFSKNHTYTPKKTVYYERYVKECYRSSNGLKMAGMVEIIIDVYMKIPKSAKKSDRELMITNKKRPIKRPDVDNLGKSIADSLNGVAYDDDSQIVDMHIRKWYAIDDYVIIDIKEVYNG